MEPQNYISMITDGMAQSHCVLPWLKNLSSLKTLTQHIQGWEENNILPNVS